MLFLGYPFREKRYKLYNISSKSFFVCRDVVFHEHMFSFTLSKFPPSPFSHVLFAFYFDDIFFPITPYFPPTNSTLEHSSYVSSVFVPNNNSFVPPISIPNYTSSVPPISVRLVSTANTVTPSISIRYYSRPHFVPKYLHDYFFLSYLGHTPSQVSSSVPFLSSTDKHTIVVPQTYA